MWWCDKYFLQSEVWWFIWWDYRPHTSPHLTYMIMFAASILRSPEQELLARYLLSRLVEVEERREKVAERRQDQDPAPSIVYPQVSAQSITQPLRKLLEKAKESIDVIDFTKHYNVSVGLTALLQAVWTHERTAGANWTKSANIKCFSPTWWG